MVAFLSPNSKPPTVDDVPAGNPIKLSATDPTTLPAKSYNGFDSTFCSVNVSVFADFGSS